MAKALFLSLPLHGHTNPTLPLVRELVAHGESIVYFSSPPFAAKIEHAGGHYRPYRNAFLEEIRDLPERVHQLAWLLMRTTAEVLDEEREIFRAERPDYIICDSVAPWGQCVGQLLRIPVVTSISTFAFNRRVLAYAATRGIRPKSARIFLSKAGHVFKALLLRRKVRRRHGVAPRMLQIVSGRSDLNIVYTSRYFQPRAESFNERYQFVGPSISARLSTETFPWDRVRDAMARLRFPRHHIQRGTRFFSRVHRGVSPRSIPRDHVDRFQYPRDGARRRAAAISPSVHMCRSSKSSSVPAFL